MRVLYLHSAATFGGASKSLIELYSRLREIGVEGVVLTPAGSASTAFAEAGMDVRAVKGLSQFDNTRFGYYRNLRWLILLRELFLLPSSVFGLWRLRRERFDLIHVNEVTLLPIGLLAKKLLGVPMVVHVRSLQREPRSGRRTRLINKWLREQAAAVVAIDHTVARTLEPDLPLHVVHNGFRIDVACAPEGSVNERGNQPLRVGFLGVLIPSKGIYELIEAIRILKERGVRIECLIAGENAHQLSGISAWALRTLGFARDVRAELTAMIDHNGLRDCVRLLGFVGDVRTLYPKLDVLCFSSHLDAAGRPVFEAAFYGIPSIVAIANPTSDALVHGVTGLAIPRPEPKLIADALEKLVREPDYRRTLGRQARDWANEHFVIERAAASIRGIYSRILSR
jgi:glycosyltransferase involved in cell wall biosynthesis